MKKVIMIALPLAVVMALVVVGGCKNELPVEVPLSSQTSSLITKVYDDDFHPQYDIYGHNGQYIVERVGLNPRQATSTAPTIKLIDPKCHAAITRGDSCLRMTLTNVTNTWMDWFFYDLEKDPKYAYDPDRPDCWAGNNGPGGSPPFDPLDRSYGQDWTQYTHFMCDMWINPEKPLHNKKGWWASIGFFTEMSDHNELWALERGADGGWDCYYWTHKSAYSRPHVGPMKLAWRFNVDGNPSSANGDRRWTRLGATGKMSFILGGDQICLNFGGELYIDNMRVVRVEKPFWESFDHMAQHDQYNENAKEMRAVGFSQNEYCYSPLHPDYADWVSAGPQRVAVDY